MMILKIGIMSGAFFAGGVLLKEFSESDRVVHLVMAFCAYGIGNCMLLLLMSETGLARAMVISSCAQIALTTAVAIIHYNERITMTQGMGVVLAICAAALVMSPASDA